jgi:hypothetical protein
MGDALEGAELLQRLDKGARPLAITTGFRPAANAGAVRLSIVDIDGIILQWEVQGESPFLSVGPLCGWRGKARSQASK